MEEEGGAKQEDAVLDGGDSGLVNSDTDAGASDISNLVEVTEVAFLLWALLSNAKFKMSEFSLGAFESGLRNPANSDVMGCAHSILLLSEKEREKFRKEHRVGASIRMPFDWWTDALNNQVRNWVKLRRELAYSTRIMEEGEEEYYNEEVVNENKENIALLDEYLKPILLGPIPPMQDLTPAESESEEDKNPESGAELSAPTTPIMKETRKEKAARLKRERQEALAKIEAEEEKLIDAIMPFHGPESYMFISPQVRLNLLRSLIMWRAEGFPQPDVLEILREFPEEEPLRLEPIGFDQFGRRYWHFPQFSRDCRIYRETPMDGKMLKGKSKPVSGQGAAKEQQEAEEAKAAEAKAAEAKAAKEKAEEEEQKKAREEEQDKQASKKRPARGSKKASCEENNDEDEAERLNREFGGEQRRSSRSRQQVQRFDQEQAAELATRKRGIAAFVPEDDEEDQPKNRTKRGASRPQNGSKKQKKSGAESNMYQFFIDGPEVTPAAWELIVNDIDALHALVKEVEGYSHKKANESLLSELNNLVTQMEKEQDNIRRQQLRIEKQERFFSMPRKRSTRTEAIEERKKKEEEDNAQREEIRRLQEEERKEKRRQQEEAKKEREREERALERERQKAYEEQMERVRQERFRQAEEQRQRMAEAQRIEEELLLERRRQNEERRAQQESLRATNVANAQAVQSGQAFPVARQTRLPEVQPNVGAGGSLHPPPQYAPSHLAFLEQQVTPSEAQTPRDMGKNAVTAPSWQQESYSQQQSAMYSGSGGYLAYPAQGTHQLAQSAPGYLQPYSLVGQHQHLQQLQQQQQHQGQQMQHVDQGIVNANQTYHVQNWDQGEPNGY